jgi:hypothetical protein
LAHAQELAGAGRWQWASNKVSREALSNGFLVSDVEDRIEALRDADFRRSTKLREPAFGAHGRVERRAPAAVVDRWLDVYVSTVLGIRTYVKFEILDPGDDPFLLVWTCHPAIRKW